MNRIIFLFLVFLFFLHTTLNAQQKVGIVLSGGGAKGLSHIGFLKALDEHHIKVDYITGTSMGAIIGGLYAMGYSAEEIEKIAKSENWEGLMTNYLPMSDISIEEKDEYQKFIGEFPIVKGEIQLPASLLRGQKLENRLSELTLPTYMISNFDSLPIPFRCIATDIVTGKPVVIKTGSLGRAMRASMGMPTLFRPIDYEGRLLIDGGIVRNFPVQEVIDMGANFVIGNYVGTDLYDENGLQSFDKVILQIGNFNDFYDVVKQKQKCDVLIEPDLTSFSTMSFEAVDSLIDLGYAKAITVLKDIRIDTLKSISSKHAINFSDSIRIDSLLFEGVRKTDIKLLKGKLRIYKGDTVSVKEIEDGTARVFGTRNFEKVTFRVERKLGVNCLIIEVIERDHTFFKFALNYNNEIGVALIANTTFRNLIGNRSRALASINISENPRVKLDYFKYFGPKQNLGFRVSNNLDYIKIPLYKNDVTISVDRYAFINTQLALQSSFSRTMAISSGFSLDNVIISPTDDYIDLFTRQTFSSLKTFLKYEINTLERRNFPNKGLLFNFRYLLSFNAKSSSFDDNLTESLIGSETPAPYSQLFINLIWNAKVSNRLTLIEEFNTGLTFDDKILYTDNMFIGGLPNTLRNTVSFPGMRLYDAIRSNFAFATTGLQFRVYHKFFALGKVGVIRFGDSADFYAKDSQNLSNYEFGGLLGLGYRSILGPIYLGYARSSVIDFGLLNFSLGYNF